MPDIIGKTLTEAIKILKEQGFDPKINDESENLNKDEVLVTKQIPSAGIEAFSGSRGIFELVKYFFL